MEWCRRRLDSRGPRTRHYASAWSAILSIEAPIHIKSARRTHTLGDVGSALGESRGWIAETRSRNRRRDRRRARSSSGGAFSRNKAADGRSSARQLIPRRRESALPAPSAHPIDAKKPWVRLRSDVAAGETRHPTGRSTESVPGLRGIAWLTTLTITRRQNLR